MSKRTNDLADRLEQGAHALAAFANELTDAEWQMVVPKDGRTIGVIVHHVASVYPLEIQLAQMVSEGKAVTDVTSAAVNKMNAGHAKKYQGVTKEAALDLLRSNLLERRVSIRALLNLPRLMLKHFLHYSGDCFVVLDMQNPSRLDFPVCSSFLWIH